MGKARSVGLVIAVWVALAVVSTLGVLALLVYGFSLMSTHPVAVRIDGTVHDRETGQPVPRCLLSFEESGNGNSPAYDGRTSSTRTDVAGHDTYSASYTAEGFPYVPFASRAPRLRIYIGGAPRYGLYDEVETWEITLRFRQPLRSGVEVVPDVEIRRFMAHNEVMTPPAGKQWRSAGMVPLAGGPDDAKVEARVSVEKEGAQRVYQVPLDVYLTPAQVAACQALSRP